MQTAIIILVAIVLVVVVFLIFTYNGLVRMRQRVQNAWSQMDVQMKRRYDLIPNLVNTVKGYATHERETFEKVTAARNMAMSAKNISEQAQAENMLSDALKSLFAVAEAYPDLKANANFLQLQAELSDTENKIAYARQFFNDTVQTFNTRLETFPTNLIAGMLGFRKVDYFELGGGRVEAQAVTVNFGQ